MSRTKGAVQALRFRKKRIRWEGSYLCDGSYRRNLGGKRGGKLEKTCGGSGVGGHWKGRRIWKE